MSKLQITIGQSEILMALRSILNCSNDELIPRVTELAGRNEEQHFRLTPKENHYFHTLRKRDTTVTLKRDNSGFARCSCGKVMFNINDKFCGKCGQRTELE